MPKFVYNSLFQFGKDDTKYDLVSKEGISERNQAVILKGQINKNTYCVKAINSPRER